MPADKSLKDLIERIEKEAGIEVYAHAVGRPDLNDWLPDESNYIRAQRNLRNPKPDCYSKIPIHTGHYDSNKERYPKPYEFDFVLYGSIIDEKTISEEVEVKEGMLGLIGLKKSKEVTRTIYEPRALSEVINTDNQNPAYFVSMTIRTDISDELGRPCQYPWVSIVGDKNLISDIVEYLMANPKEYVNFIQNVLPEKEFPIVNKQMVSKIKPSESILFVDVDKIDKNRAIGDFEKYGTKILK